jgi:hypothetical protein
MLHLTGLLRARRERPRDSSAAEESNELAPFHGLLPPRTDPCESEATRTGAGAGAEKLEMKNGSAKAAQLVIPSSQK